MPVTDERPAYAELEHLAGELPPKERAAVVLRYGYDLSYDDIGAALGFERRSGPPGRLVRRPAPAKEEQPMTAPHELDRRFRDAAAAEGLLDVAYDLTDSPVGPLLVAASERGLCRISFDPEPEREVEALARAFGARVLRSPQPVDEVRRELDEYFEGRAPGLRPAGRPHSAARLPAEVLAELVRVPYGDLDTYGGSRSASATRAPRARSAGRSTATRSRSSSRATASSARREASPATAAGSSASGAPRARGRAASDVRGARWTGRSGLAPAEVIPTVLTA